MAQANQVVDRTAEKMELANTLGMQMYWEANKQRLETAKAIKELTDLNFKPCTDERLEKVLRKRVWHGYFGTDRLGNRGFTWLGELLHAFGFIGIISPAVLIVDSFVVEEPLPLSKVYFTLVIGAICFLTHVLSRFQKCAIESRPLAKWTDNIPYGALLAAKEAKEKGATDLTVYYPVRNTERVLCDPVLTALYKGIRVEVFAWDDGKVYE